jgi:hypothetical protein
MSHIATVKCEIKDLAAAEEAAKALGCIVEHGTKPRYWGTQYGNGGEAKVCDLVVKLPGKYDLGLFKNADETYSFMSDNELMSGSLGRNDAGRVLLGENAGKFRQEYAAAVAMKAARKKGIPAFRKVREDGNVVITLRA